ncbi:hypothetical protein EGR_03073 [Echinococcus granulosus]|uniref:Uncharacterized protein n=1 Tax=Echinococcus granulosus TaxID=6210 RepID=W6UUJ9_ECHGR|nr:hypothetical protein EGR_03073 [Echinococcus granulosus]EUB62052.1 hypothetical protein EGR_03073 [Echinococcus granulosus]
MPSQDLFALPTIYYRVHSGFSAAPGETQKLDGEKNIGMVETNRPLLSIDEIHTEGVIMRHSMYFFRDYCGRKVNGIFFLAFGRFLWEFVEKMVGHLSKGQIISLSSNLNRNVCSMATSLRFTGCCFVKSDSIKVEGSSVSFGKDRHLNGWICTRTEEGSGITDVQTTVAGEQCPKGRISKAIVFLTGAMRQQTFQRVPLCDAQIEQVLKIFYLVKDELDRIMHNSYAHLFNSCMIEKTEKRLHRLIFQLKHLPYRKRQKYPIANKGLENTKKLPKVPSNASSLKSSIYSPNREKSA